MADLSRVLRDREIFEAGARWMFDRISVPGIDDQDKKAIKPEAKRRYPAAAPSPVAGESVQHPLAIIEFWRDSCGIGRLPRRRPNR